MESRDTKKQQKAEIQKIIERLTNTQKRKSFNIKEVVADSCKT